MIEGNTEDTCICKTVFDHIHSLREFYETDFDIIVGKTVCSQSLSCVNFTAASDRADKRFSFL